jgi:hypothetical protein
MKVDSLRFWPNGQRLQLDGNASHHGSHCSRTRLNDNGLSLTELPPHSTDHNFIANLWVRLNRRVGLRRARSIQELSEIFNQEWANAS